MERKNSGTQTETSDISLTTTWNELKERNSSLEEKVEEMSNSLKENVKTKKSRHNASRKIGCYEKTKPTNKVER